MIAWFGPRDPVLFSVRADSAARLTVHHAAIEWLHSLPVSFGIVWMAQSGTEPDATALRSYLPRWLTRQSCRSSADPHNVAARRTRKAITERVAMHAALLDICPAPHRFYLAHTPLGQPLVRWRDARWAREYGVKARNLHISFSHDGDAHLALTAYAPGLRGIGIDIVHLPRLRSVGKDRGYLLRFAQRFMSEIEFAEFTAFAKQESDEDLVRRVAGHFSLMEAASKAFGTGLKIGGGMGKPESLPKQDIGIMTLEPEVAFSLGPEAMKRCSALRANRLEGHWGADAEYLVSAALLWE